MVNLKSSAKFNNSQIIEKRGIMNSVLVIVNIMKNIWLKILLQVNDKMECQKSVFFNMYGKHSTLNYTEGKRNWVFATNLNFLTPISLQPDGVSLWYFKIRLFDLIEF